jgi:IclR family acetate operon transcriptional repressor
MMKHTPEAARLTHQSLERGLRILEDVSSSGGTSTLAETARRTGLHRSTAHHLLQTLVGFGYLRQDPQTRAYALTAKLFRLTARTWTPEQIGQMAQPVAAELTALTGEGASVAAYCDGGVTIVAKCDPDNPFRVVQDIGAKRPIHATAVAKAIVAFLPPVERTTIIEQIQFDRFTPRTITSRKAFEAELRRIRAAGYANDDEEHYDGVRCIAAPVFAYTGHAAAALCIVGPKVRLTRKRLRDLREPLLEGAQQLSIRLGWTGEPAVARNAAARVAAAVRAE